MHYKLFKREEDNANDADPTISADDNTERNPKLILIWVFLKKYQALLKPKSKSKEFTVFFEENIFTAEDKVTYPSKYKF